MLQIFEKSFDKFRKAYYGVRAIKTLCRIPNSPHSSGINVETFKTLLQKGLYIESRRDQSFEKCFLIHTTHCLYPLYNNIKKDSFFSKSFFYFDAIESHPFLGYEYMEIG